jgi:long-chain fatty acid transport protein
MSLRPFVAAATTQLACAALLLATAPTDSRAAAAWLQETGGTDTGMAGAGRAALWLDAAALASNPAAMANFSGTTVTTVAMPFDLQLEFSGSDATPAHARDRSEAFTVPALYAAHRSGRFAYGLAAYSYLGMSFDLGDDWAGRRVIQSAGLSTFNIAPAVAWTATDRLTLGASLGAQRLQYDATMAVANDAVYYGPPADLPDGEVTLDGSSWAPAGQVGLQYRATDRLQLGAAWTAAVDHSAVSNVAARGVHPVLGMVLPADGDVTLDLTLPQQVLLGAAYRTPRGTLLTTGASWQDWSSLGESTLRLPSQASAMFPAGLRDTWGASLGVRQALGRDWDVTAGMSYESNPAPDAGLPAYFPVAEQWRVAAGAQRAFGDDLRLRLMMSVLEQGNTKVVQTTHPVPLPGIGPLTGRYENARAYMLGFAADFAL